MAGTERRSSCREDDLLSAGTGEAAEGPAIPRPRLREATRMEPREAAVLTDTSGVSVTISQGEYNRSSPSLCNNSRKWRGFRRTKRSVILLGEHMTALGYRKPRSTTEEMEQARV